MVFHGGERVYILIVDDKEHFARQIARALKAVCGEEIDVFTARSGDDALSTIAENPNDELRALITNFRLPGMTGGELAQRVAELLPGANILFVLWTKKIDGNVMSSSHFRIIRQKDPNIEAFAETIARALLLQ